MINKEDAIKFLLSGDLEKAKSALEDDNYYYGAQDLDIVINRDGEEFNRSEIEAQGFIIDDIDLVSFFYKANEITAPEPSLELLRNAVGTLKYMRTWITQEAIDTFKNEGRI